MGAEGLNIIVTTPNNIKNLMQLINSTPHVMRPLGWVVACALVFAGAFECTGQCTEASTLLHYEAPCGSGLNVGQSFTAPITGHLDSIRLSRCTGTDTRLAIRTYNGTGEDWNEGYLVGEANAILEGGSDGDACYTSGGNGFSHYAMGLFTFSDLALQENQQYTIHLISGAAATGCNLPYEGGSAFATNGAKPGEDLAFDLYMCPGNEAIQFGSTFAPAGRGIIMVAKPINCLRRMSYSNISICHFNSMIVNSSPVHAS